MGWGWDEEVKKNEGIKVWEVGLFFGGGWGGNGIEGQPRRSRYLFLTG